MPSVTCVICLDSDHRNWSALSCGHVFHQSCLRTWMQQNPVCPQCKQHPRCNPLRIYLDSQENPESRHAGVEGAAAAEPVRPEDPNEVEQLRQFLFHEAQEKDAAWRHANDSDKRIARLRRENDDLQREVLRLEREVETSRVTCSQQETELEQILRLGSQAQQDNQERIQRLLLLNSQLESSNEQLSQRLQSCEQLQLLNSQLESRNEQLSQRLQSSEQQNSELSSTLASLQSSDIASTSRFEATRRQLESEAEVQTTELNGCKWQLEMEQRSRQLESAQLQALKVQHSLLTEQLKQLPAVKVQNSELTEQVRQLQASYMALKNAANNEVNKQKTLCSDAHRKLQDLERTNMDLTKILNNAELENNVLKQEVEKLQNSLLSQLKINEQPAEQPVETTLNLPEPILNLVWDGTTGDPLLERATTDEAVFDNFSDFQVFNMPSKSEGVVTPTLNAVSSGLQQSAETLAQPTQDSPDRHDISRPRSFPRLQPQPPSKYLSSWSPVHLNSPGFCVTDDRTTSGRGIDPLLERGTTDEAVYENFSGTIRKRPEQYATSIYTDGVTAPTLNASSTPQRSPETLTLSKRESAAGQDISCPTSRLGLAPPQQPKLQLQGRAKSAVHLNNPEGCASQDPAALAGQRRCSFDALRREQSADDASVTKCQSQRNEAKKSKNGRCKQM